MGRRLAGLFRKLFILERNPLGFFRSDPLADYGGSLVVPPLSRVERILDSEACFTGMATSTCCSSTLSVGYSEVSSNISCIVSSSKGNNDAF